MLYSVNKQFVLPVSFARRDPPRAEAKAVEGVVYFEGKPSALPSKSLRQSKPLLVGLTALLLGVSNPLSFTTAQANDPSSAAAEAENMMDAPPDYEQREMDVDEIIYFHFGKGRSDKHIVGHYDPMFQEGFKALLKVPNGKTTWFTDTQKVRVILAAAAADPDLSRLYKTKGLQDVVDSMKDETLKSKTTRWLEAGFEAVRDGKAPAALSQLSNELISATGSPCHLLPRLGSKYSLWYACQSPSHTDYPPPKFLLPAQNPYPFRSRVR